jgi:DNA-binding NarL/FixJ family response regulator
VNIGQHAQALLVSKRPSKLYKPSKAYNRIYSRRADIRSLARRGLSYSQIAEQLSVNAVTLTKYVPQLFDDDTAALIARNGFDNMRFSRSGKR